jgi:hypothetical protein
MTPEDIAPYFTRSDGSYACARWGRPIAPVVFGVEPASLSVINAAAQAIARMAGIGIMETDPELGSNLMMFFCRTWDELLEVPDLDKLIPELKGVVGRLKTADANQYRIFRFEDNGAIKACFVFILMDERIAELPADTLALTQMTQSILMWSDVAFKASSPLAVLPNSETVVLRPEIAAIIRSAYDAAMPVAAKDASHALRMSARVNLHLGEAIE